MATKQISALNPKPTAVAGTDKFGIDDVNSVSWRVSASSVLTYFLGNLPAGLVSIGNLNTNTNMMIYTTATNTYATTTITAFGRTLVASVDASAARTSLALGTAAIKTASGSGSTVASISGSITLNHIAQFADSSGTLKDGGALSQFLSAANNLSDVASKTTAFDNVSPTTSKGDLIAYDGTDNVRVAVGSNNSILVADSTQSAGIKWASATGIINTWVTVTGTTQTMAVNTGYTANNVSQVVFTLPTTSNPGDLLEVAGLGAGGWKIIYGTGQQIIFGNLSSTITSGSLASTNQNDGVLLRCVIANTTWKVNISPQGNLDVI